MSRPTSLTINLAALTHNLERVHQLAPGKSVLAMVKANAYGHGIVPVAKALSDISKNRLPLQDTISTDMHSRQSLAFGVASLEEGIKLREAGISSPIVLMEGLFHFDELTEALRYDFSLVVHHREHVEFLEKINVDKPFSIWLKINTGMHRLGIDPSETQQIFQRLQRTQSVKKPIGFMTHFAEADDIHSLATSQQIKLFAQVTQNLPGPRSLANSAAILAWPQAHADWVRPGLVLYGASPFAEHTGLDHDLKPVMTLSSKIIAITEVAKGGKVGYGGTFTAPEKMTIGVVCIGYGDGYPQFAMNGTPVLVSGTECSLVGRVSMDMLTVDLRSQPQAKIGDTVILWGENLPVERVAKHSNTSAYEILTRMTPRPKIEIKL